MAKADYWSEQSIVMWRLIFGVTLVLATVMVLFIYFNSRGAAVPVAEVPEFNVEPTTTISARP